MRAKSTIVCLSLMLFVAAGCVPLSKSSSNTKKETPKKEVKHEKKKNK